jgi:hypothetical protein
VTVEPASDLGKDFLWADKAWTRQFSGNINLWFFALLAGAIAIIAAFVGTILLLLSARRHPLSGYVEVFQEVPEEALTNEGGPSTYRKTVYRQQLPRRNRVTLRPRGGKLPIKWIKVTCPTDDDAKAGRARIEAALTGKGTPLSVTLDPSQPPTSLTMGYFIEKGPRMLDLPGPDVLAAETYAVSERR